MGFQNDFAMQAWMFYVELDFFPLHMQQRREDGLDYPFC